MNAFVTGSTGLLGSNLVKQLLAQGHTVKALARDVGKASKQLGNTPTLEIVKGDMEALSQFTAALQGCDVLFHCAAYFREYYGAGDHWGKLKAINVDGTIALLNAAEQHQLKKVIYVSSSGVIGHAANGAASDESTPPDPDTDDNLYFKSKVLAEKVLADWMKTHTLPVSLILPTWMYGPQDAAPTTAGSLVLNVLGQKIPAVPPGSNNVVDARDVAAAMIQSVDKGKSGERYIVSGSEQTLWDIAQTVGKVGGVRAPQTRLSYPVALAVAWVAQTVAKLQGKETLMSVNGIRTLKNGHMINDAKARRELNHTPRPFEETLRDTVQWYRSNGFA